jgi:hypothetical protein
MNRTVVVPLALALWWSVVMLALGFIVALVLFASSLEFKFI